MNKLNIFKWLMVFTACTVGVSCSKNLLEVAPNNVLSDANFWKTENDAVEGVNAVYLGLIGSAAWGYADFYGGCLLWLDDISDDGFWVANGHATENDGWGGIANATETPLGDNSYVARTWAGSWNIISLANNALYKIPGISFSDPTLQKRLMAECKALRAIAYRYLTVRWGGVPLITQPLSQLANKTPARNSYDTCHAQIIKDLQEAIPDLPTSYSGADVGRMTQGAAMTLLMTQYLWDKDWADAAKTASQIEGLGVYQLLPHFGDLWTYGNKNTQESILEIQFGDNKSNILPVFGDGWFPIGTKFGYNGWGGFDTPQQQMVNEYERVQYDGSGNIIGTQPFDPNTISTLYDTMQYKSRDPRFYISVWYNGADYFGEPYNPDWYSGCSGYHWRKYNSAPKAELRNLLPDYNHIVFRYAYVLLAYAEAQNEASGPDATVYDAVNQIRQRAGMPGLPAGLSQDQMRQAIRHEYRVELAGEGYRYEFLLRWGLFQSAIANRGVNNGRQFGNVVIPDFRLLYPIPQTEINANPNMKQNPGY